MRSIFVCRCANRGFAFAPKNTRTASVRANATARMANSTTFIWKMSTSMNTMMMGTMRLVRSRLMSSTWICWALATVRTVSVDAPKRL